MVLFTVYRDVLHDLPYREVGQEKSDCLMSVHTSVESGEFLWKISALTSFGRFGSVLAALERQLKAPTARAVDVQAQQRHYYGNWNCLNHAFCPAHVLSSHRKETHYWWLLPGWVGLTLFHYWLMLGQCWIYSTRYDYLIWFASEASPPTSSHNFCMQSALSIP